MQRFLAYVAIVICVSLFLTNVTHADVVILMEEPYGEFGHYNPTGHAAIFLDRICAQSPSQLRSCLVGEDGVVVSRYHRVAGYDWLAMPPIPYFYAVSKREDIPSEADRGIRDALRNRYRHEKLAGLIPDVTDEPEESPQGNWTQLVGASYDRRIFGFRIQTTEDQDLLLMARLNERKNADRFNIFVRNCADFTRGVLNFYYPGALRRNYLVDFGITTPKEDAKRLTRFAKRHPELHFSSFVIPQIAGSIPRSRRIDNVAEALVRSKKYLLPLVVLQPEFAGALMGDVLIEDHHSSWPKHSVELPEDASWGQDAE